MATGSPLTKAFCLPAGYILSIASISKRCSRERTRLKSLYERKQEEKIFDVNTNHLADGKQIFYNGWLHSFSLFRTPLHFADPKKSPSRIHSWPPLGLNPVAQPDSFLSHSFAFTGGHQLPAHPLEWELPAQQFCHK